jgi:chemotaxis protein MotA
MEKSTPIGLIAGLGLVFGAIFLGDGWTTFFDIRSMVLVGGGTVAALLIGFSLAEVKAMVPGTKGLFKFQPPDNAASAAALMDLSRLVRRDGLLALDRKLGEVEDPLLRLGLEMAVDGVEADEIETILRTKVMEEMKDRQLTARFFGQAGLYAPAFGMVGTLIGLIQMLQNLNDPASIGPAMAVAMITTFYGALLANLIFLPAAAKVRAQTASVATARQLAIAGVVALVRGEAPMLLERRLSPYVPGGLAPAPAAVPTPLSRAA